MEVGAYSSASSLYNYTTLMGIGAASFFILLYALQVHHFRSLKMSGHLLNMPRHLAAIEATVLGATLEEVSILGGW